MARHGALNTFGRSGNPIIRSPAFKNTAGTKNEMTLDGAVNKTGLSLFMVVVMAALVWTFNDNPLVMLLSYVALLSGSIAAVVTFGFIWPLPPVWLIKPRPHLAPKTMYIYALGEGAFVAHISMFFEAAYPGIVIQAVSLTFFVAASLLFAYKSGIIKPTQNFLLIMFAATMGIFLFYLFALIMYLVTGSSLGIISGNSNMAIILSLFIVGIAALNLVLDFDIIEQSADQGAPKYMEDFGAMALTATLVWLYAEILRLIAKLRSR